MPNRLQHYDFVDGATHTLAYIVGDALAARPVGLLGGRSLSGNRPSCGWPDFDEITDAMSEFAAVRTEISGARIVATVPSANI